MNYENVNRLSIVSDRRSAVRGDNRGASGLLRREVRIPRQRGEQLGIYRHIERAKYKRGLIYSQIKACPTTNQKIWHYCRYWNKKKT